MVISTRDIINKYIASYLRRRGLNWVPKQLNRAGGKINHIAKDLTDEDKRTLEDVCQSMQEISDELHEFIRRTHKDRFRQLASKFLDSFNYEALKTMMDELFAKEVTWNHIVTFLVYGAELADRAIESGNINGDHKSHTEHSKTQGDHETSDEEEDDNTDDENESDVDDKDDSSSVSRDLDEKSGSKVSQIVDWMCTYIDNNLLQWIEDQEGGWQSIKKLHTSTNLTKGFSMRGMKHYFGVAAFAVFLGGLYLRSKLTV